jgi:hypothetical protein
VFFQRNGIRAPTNHKSKYKKEINCGEKKVGGCRASIPRRKKKGNYRVSVRPF